MHEKLLVAFIEARETNGKFFKKKKKKNSINFLTKIPQGLTGKEFCSECKEGIFALKLLDSIFKGPRKKRKSI